jgi:polysaccharide deacetylase family protein (PEP-CTERM system associated)
MNILTFDIEDWFHLLGNPGTAGEREWKNFEPRIHENFNRLIETLLLHEQKATFFCLGWIADQYPEIIRQINSLGFEVASHSYMHQLAYEQTKNFFTKDLKKSIQVLEDLTGKKVRSFRAPGFSVTRDNPWVFEALVENGIENDCSVFPTAHGHGGFKDFGSAKPCIVKYRGLEIRELPMSHGKFLGKNIVFSGGGYFRILPYRVIQNLTEKSEYLMSYFHPRDFDADQPVLDLPLHRRFKSYVGLKHAHKKFDRWLANNSFTDVEGAIERTNWSKAPVIQLI